MKVAFVYVTDERGYELMKHSAVSLALSQPKPCNIQVWCYQFLPGPSDSLPRALAELGANVTIAPLSDPDLEQHETCLHVTKPSLLKLPAVERLVDDYDRVVFLDNDLLIFDDLRIDRLAFGAAPIAAVTDLDLSDTGWLRNSARAGTPAIDSGRGYFNSGFMVFESRNWLHGEFYDRYAAALHAHDAKCPYKVACTSIEQCALNMVFEDNWLRLPVGYNMQASAKFTAAWQTAPVRHYCGSRKFIPVSLFRNDGRDVGYINEIRRRLGLKGSSSQLLHQMLFNLNVVRHAKGSSELQSFLTQYA
jgi:lipopolysaccharide biosynthesis glycosyltransferase